MHLLPRLFLAANSVPADADAMTRLVTDHADKPGVKGKVISINLFYTTLQDLSEEAVGAVLQVPNSLFFQKSVRRWR